MIPESLQLLQALAKAVEVCFRGIQNLKHDNLSWSAEIVDNLEHKEEINSQPEQNEETRFQKNEEEHEDSGTSPKVPASES